MYTESELMDKKPKELLDIVLQIQEELKQAKQTIGKQVAVIASFESSEKISQEFEELKELAMRRLMNEIKSTFQS